MSKADDDARPLRQIVLDSDWRLACALASSTDTDPLIWAGLLAKGVPFIELQKRASEVVRKRVEFYRARKRRKSA